MISLRKAIEAQSEELFHQTLEAYRQTLGSIAEAGGRAYPPSEGMLRDSLVQLQKALAEDAAIETIASTGARAGTELREWGEQAHKYYEKKADEVKEVLLIVGDMADHLADRDQRNVVGFSQLTARLNAAVKLHDLGQIRQRVLESVRELHTEVARMEREANDTVAELRSQVATYQSHLETAERLASQDPLTGIFNRRALEARLEQYERAGNPFCVILLDLDDFKTINDTLGHPAGDDLLKQFARELKGAMRATDVAGRWGGDEFMALVDGSFQEAEGCAKRVEDWVNGEYLLQSNPVQVRASVGIAAWQGGESILSVVERADAKMYTQKPKHIVKS